MDAEKAIRMIDEYLAEPNSIHRVWIEILSLSREALEKQISKKCITDDGVVEVLQRKLELTMNFLADDADNQVIMTVAEIKNSLDLIYRQKVEIERLQAEGLQINETFMDFVKKEKAEAIKEFGVKWHKKLKTARAKLFEESRLVKQAFKIAASITDEIVKEMVEV